MRTDHLARAAWRCVRGRVTLLTLACLMALVGPGAVAGAGDDGADPLAGGWAEWDANDGPVYEGQYIASDPTVLAAAPGGPYRMFHTCYRVPAGPFDPATVRAAICAATSPDGLDWTPVDSGDPDTPGLVLAGREGAWDENLEGSFAMVRDGRYLLWYSGYDHVGDPALGYPASLAVAESRDGVTFTRLRGGDPVLAPRPGWYDNDAVYSPTIVEWDDGLAMVYAGHCYTDCDEGYGNTLLGATSRDGVEWERLDEPVLRGGLEGAAWTADGVAEPGLLRGEDGHWYLGFTGLAGEDRAIGIAVGDSPFGPWEYDPEPIITGGAGWDRAGVLAPSFLLEGDTVRAWYLGMGTDEDIAIGYAEAPWPLLGG